MQFEYSAGGIVYKKTGKKLLILVSQHSQHHGWVFPKGLIGDHNTGETKENTALREVEEETGIQGRIILPLTPVTYWYVMDSIKRKKTVYYFLMECLGGNIKDHDWEMEQVEWLEAEKVGKRLTFPSDRKVWKEAQKKLRNSLKDS